MPQEFRVVQCYSCCAFQVDIVKKSKKWTCKICNETQTFRQEFGRGTAKDCRLHCQKLNSSLGQQLDDDREKIVEMLENNSSIKDKTFPSNRSELSSDTSISHLATENDENSTSKWLSFIDQKDDDDKSDEEVKLMLETDSRKVIKRSNDKKLKPANKHFKSNNENIASDIHCNEDNNKSNIEHLFDLFLEDELEYSEKSFSSPEKNKNSANDKNRQSTKTQVDKVASASSKWDAFIEDDDDSN